MTRPKLPDFTHPPVVEVALSMQFRSLKKFHAAHFGQFWTVLGTDKFLRTEEQPPVPGHHELPGVENPVPRFEILNILPLPRCLFVSESGAEVIQVQQDRFTYNWRKQGDAPYPRYEFVEKHFSVYADLFKKFVSDKGIGELDVLQSEVTYVNRIEAPMRNVVSLLSGAFSDDFLTEPEEIRLSMTFPMKNQGDFAGRLRIDSLPSATTEEGAVTLSVSLTARGRPQTPTIAGATEFAKLGRKWIVAGFASITTAEMHEKWGRCDDH